MEPGLSPREIQDRIRSGASVAEVAEEAGSSAELVAPFAGPILAERAHVVTTALASPIKLRDDGPSNRTLSDVVTSRLQARGLDIDDVSWDAWRLPDRRWRLVGVHTSHDLERRAEFLFDLKRRFSVSDNADARWMVGEASLASEDDDQESTVDLNDELALMRAVSEPTEDTERDFSLAVNPEEVAEYTEPELSEVDGLYDIVGPKQSQMDVLYDMLSGISEDSVKIYTGLTQPIVESEEVEIEETVIAEEPAPEEPPAQEALVEAPEPVKKKRRRKSKRAEVPSWDEILFGTKPKQ